MKVWVVHGDEGMIRVMIDCTNSMPKLSDNYSGNNNFNSEENLHLKFIFIIYFYYKINYLQILSIFANDWHKIC